VCIVESQPQGRHLLSCFNFEVIFQCFLVVLVDLGVGGIG
jgi:hypothetical protein